MAVTLLLPFDGSDGDTTTTDLSATGRTVTFNGGAEIDTAQSVYGGSSLLLTNSGYLSLSGTIDIQDSWTFECRARFVSLSSSQDLISTRPTVGGTEIAQGFAITVTPSGNIACFGWRPNQTYVQRDATSAGITTDTWYHIAVSYDGSNIRFFVNGVPKGTVSHASTDFTNSSLLYLGVVATATDRFMGGHLEDVRWTQGSAIYTTAFTPPGPLVDYYSNSTLVLPFDGADESTAIIDASPVGNTVTPTGNAQLDIDQSEFGGSSLLLDGSGDYLVVGAAGDFNCLHNGSDFTIQGRLRTNGSQNTQAIFDTGGPQTAARGGFLWINASGHLQYYVSNGSGTYSLNIEGSTVVGADDFIHWAVTCKNNTVRIFLGGNLEASGSLSSPSAVNSNYALKIGARAFDNGLNFNGWFDDISIIEGLALYTSSFIPPSEPFFVPSTDRPISVIQSLKSRFQLVF
jgi:hypothetical protein